MPDTPFTAPLDLFSTPIQDYRCEIVTNIECGRGLKRMRLHALNAPFECAPGQFVMFDLPESGFYFRRPFSVLLTEAPDCFDLYYKVVGSGTRIMADMTPGMHISCLGPLGKGFEPPTHPATALYIGGGIGIAPVYFLAHRDFKKGHTPGFCFYGVRSQEEIGLADDLATVFGDEHLFLATDDGSTGFHGNVVQRLALCDDIVNAAQEAYVCGPTRMMEAVCAHLYAVNPALRIQVSLEEHMPCGTGACTGCVVARPHPLLPAKVCIEGPVFEADSILWRFPAPLGSTTACKPSIIESKPIACNEEGDSSCL